MASSRKRQPKADPLETQLLDTVHAALCAAVGALRARVASGLAAPVDGETGPRRSVASSRRAAAQAPVLLVAFSGGRDSTVLLDLLWRLRAARAEFVRELRAVYVHHGLHAQADAWERSCAEFCSGRNIPFEVRRVQVERRGKGVEAAAREARYAALAEAARAHGARLVLTAHHQDDRIETFLLQWLRGSGVDGLAAMPPVREFGGDELLLVRPLLDVARAQIESYRALRALPFVDDPSNADATLGRGALRTHVLPQLDTVRSGYRRSAARSIDLVADAAAVLREVAAADLASAREDAPAGMLRIDRLAALTPERRALVVREWLAAAGLEAPTRARLREVIDQALRARADARLLVRVGTMEVRRHRGLLLLRPAQADTRRRVSLVWRGEARMAVPEWGGELVFERTRAEGFDPAWLGAQPLQLRERGGGERFKPHPTRPSKTLKRLFQDAGIAEYERAALPLVWRGDELIYVAGLGPDARLVEADGERIALRWQADASLLVGAMA
jgi:tRNA(Ile)-lysidine synthase